MPRLALLGVGLVLVAASGCGGAGSSSQAVKPHTWPPGFGPVVDSIKLPRMPSEGLAVGYRHGILLVSLNGTRIARLPGFRVFWQSADLAPLVLQGPTGRLYHLAG